MEKREFHVYIIESPNATDLYHKRFEGESLQKTLRLSGINSSHRLTANKEAFNAAFLVGLREHFTETGVSPIIHISAHGGADGIQLTSGELVSWYELQKLLIPINTVLKGVLLVSMSSCKGFSGIKMAMEEESIPFPFFAIVGNTDDPTWGETNIAYATFYHLFAQGEDLTKSVSAMAVASGNKSFSLAFAKSVRKLYLDKMKAYESKVNQAVAVETIQNAIPEEKDTFTKALE